jgi:hypothetical protein
MIVALGITAGKGNMALRPEIEKGILQQAEHCAHNAAPGTAAICRAMVGLAKGDTLCGRKIADWPGSIISGAVPLRLAGGLHNLMRNGGAPELAGVYSGDVVNQGEIDAIISAIVRRHDAELLPWFDSAPQTNEAGRSANFVAAMHWLANKVMPKFELMEIGSSAGMNLLINRFRYNLGGVMSGPMVSPVTITPQWHGNPPPDTRFEITSVRGCDLNPIDVRDDDAANRLRAYVWPEMPERFERMDAAINMVREQGVDLVQSDAADWVESQLVKPQIAGTTRTLMHSIVWQYLTSASQMRITAAMESAGAATTYEKPLAWIMLETNTAIMRHELHVRYWPGGGKVVKLAEAHAHGLWVDWHSNSE